MDLTPFKNCRAHKQWLFVSNDEPHYRPCCWFRTNIDAQDITEYRDKLANLDVEKNCTYCINMESNGGEWSPRTMFESNCGPKDLVITASFDNICNLKCVTCTPKSSSQYISEMADGELYEGVYSKSYFARLGKQAPAKTEFIKSLLANSEFDYLRFELLGGEPLINPKISEFIDWLSEQPYAKKIFLSITTNSTTYTDKVITYAEKFRDVGIQLSLDGVEDTFEYLRYGASHDTMVQNFNSFYALTDKLPNFFLSVNYTLSWMNSLHFSEWFNWLQTNYPNIANILITRLEAPVGYSLDVLSPSMREKIYNINNDSIVPINQKFADAINLYKQHMLTSYSTEFNNALFNQGLELMKDLDIKRNEDYTKVFEPILALITKELE